MIIFVVTLVHLSGYLLEILFMYMQLGFSFGGTTCLMPASAFTIFYPPLGLNDTITYYFGNFQDEL